MVPQQSQDGSTAILQSEINSKEKGELMTLDNHDGSSMVFGSQQVKETSNTPYTDATQVSTPFFPFCISMRSNLLNKAVSSIY